MSEEHQCLVITRPGGTKKGISFGGHYSQQKRGMACFGGKKVKQEGSENRAGGYLFQGRGLFILGYSYWVNVTVIEIIEHYFSCLLKPFFSLNSHSNPNPNYTLA